VADLFDESGKVSSATHHEPTPSLRLRLLLATITGAVAGVVRAATSWILDHMVH
jgi:hypothetical protein